MKNILLLISLFMIMVLVGCEKNKRAIKEDNYLWQGVIKTKPLNPDTNVIYYELPKENWVYYAQNSKNFFLYSGLTWVMLRKEDASSMNDSLGSYTAAKFRNF